MQLPAPPTDSLYKFMCIASLVGGIALIVWTDRQLFTLVGQKAKIIRELAIHEAEFRNLNDDWKRLKRRGSIMGDNSQLISREKALTVKTAELAAQRREQSDLIQRLSQRSRLIYYQLLLCGLGFTCGLIGWYLKIQVYQDRLLKAQVAAAERELQPAGQNLVRKELDG